MQEEMLAFVVGVVVQLFYKVDWGIMRDKASSS
jgi:hypothetical protein